MGPVKLLLKNMQPINDVRILTCVEVVEVEILWK